MVKSQSVRYKRGYFHKIWMEYYCLGENHASGTSSSKFIGSQNPYVPAAKSEHCFIISGDKNPQIFFPEETRLHRYHHNKNQLGVISSTYINLKINC